MNPEIKTKWLEALRSGKYEQGQNMLRTPSGNYCCLGVLCDIVAPEDWEMLHGGWCHQGYTTQLPRNVRNAAELPLLLQVVTKDYVQSSLMVLNDTGTTFAEIVDLIEAQL